jgi:DNA-binding beta-propeller fold protein YncE
MATLSSKVTPSGVATAAQGGLADSAVQTNDSPTFNVVTATSYSGDGSALTGISSGGGFKPLAVTGTTPSLDLTDYNFFSHGAMTANTTVSFTNIPTEANWRYTFNSEVVTGAGDVSTSRYVGQSSVEGSNTSPQGVEIKPDGTKIYIVGVNTDVVAEYDLAVPFDVTNLSFVGSFSVNAQDNSPWGISFKPDGTRMYVTGTTSDAVHEYTLSTAWSVTSASFVRTFSVSAQEVTPTAVTFKSDGTKMYVVGYTNDTVYEYNLSTAWNISTAVYSQGFSVGGQEGGPTGINFNTAGTKLYVFGFFGEDVNEYNLSTAWNISTAVYLQTYDIQAQLDFSPSIRAGCVHPDGGYMYAVSNGNLTAFQGVSPTPSVPAFVAGFALGETATVTFPASVTNPPPDVLANKTITYEFVTLDGGTTVNLIAEEIVAT